MFLQHSAAFWLRLILLQIVTGENQLKLTYISSSHLLKTWLPKTDPTSCNLEKTMQKNLKMVLLCDVSVPCHHLFETGYAVHELCEREQFCVCGVSERCRSCWSVTAQSRLCLCWVLPAPSPMMGQVSVWYFQILAVNIVDVNTCHDLCKAGQPASWQWRTIKWRYFFGPEKTHLSLSIFDVFILYKVDIRVNSHVAGLRDGLSDMSMGAETSFADSEMTGEDVSAALVAHPQPKLLSPEAFTVSSSRCVFPHPSLPTHRHPPTSAQAPPLMHHCSPITTYPSPLTHHVSPIATRSSLLSHQHSSTATRASPLTYHHLPTTVHCSSTTFHPSPLTDHHLPTTTHPFTLGHHLSPITAHPPLLTSHPPLPTHHHLPTIAHLSPITNHDSPTIAHLSLTTAHPSPLNHHHPPLFISHRQALITHSPTIAHPSPLTHPPTCLPWLTSYSPLVAHHSTTITHHCLPLARHHLPTMAHCSPITTHPSPTYHSSPTTAHHRQMLHLTLNCCCSPIEIFPVSVSWTELACSDCCER